MKTSTYLAGAVILVGSAFAVQVAGARGGFPGHRGGASSQKAAAESTEVTALRPAFTLLMGADHDYQGHRISAMVAIAHACRIMGTDIVPPGLRQRLEHAGTGSRPSGSATKPVGHNTGTRPATTEPEPQVTSDQQLKQAQTIVQGVRNGIATDKQTRVAELLDNAIAELNTALSIK